MIGLLWPGTLATYLQPRLATSQKLAFRSQAGKRTRASRSCLCAAMMADQRSARPRSGPCSRTGVAGNSEQAYSLEVSMQTSLRFAAKTALAALMVVLIAGLGFAQTSNGTIAGSVTDATGAAIANAKVTATSNNTGEVRTTKTNDVGAYRFESVLPGPYSIAVSAEGFAAFNLAHVNVVASVVTSANAMLKIG